MLVEMRDEVMSAFASELTRKYKLLQEQLDRDSKIEGEWKQVWVESLQKIQKIYI